jgi:hypothetical protein
LGVGAETLRKWILQVQVDAGERSGPTSEELEEIRRRAEVRDQLGMNGLVRGRGRAPRSRPATVAARRGSAAAPVPHQRAEPGLGHRLHLRRELAGFVYVAFAVDAESVIGLYKHEAVAAGSPFRTGPLRTLPEEYEQTYYAQPASSQTGDAANKKTA